MPRFVLLVHTEPSNHIVRPRSSPSASTPGEDTLRVCASTSLITEAPFPSNLITVFAVSPASPAATTDTLLSCSWLYVVERVPEYTVGEAGQTGRMSPSWRLRSAPAMNARCRLDTEEQQRSRALQLQLKHPWARALLLKAGGQARRCSVRSFPIDSKQCKYFRQAASFLSPRPLPASVS